jgi:hypothetical protein
VPQHLIEEVEVITLLFEALFVFFALSDFTTIDDVSIERRIGTVAPDRFEPFPVSIRML